MLWKFYLYFKSQFEIKRKFINIYLEVFSLIFLNDIFKIFLCFFFLKNAKNCRRFYFYFFFVSVLGRIYVCGGFDGYTRHTSMESYNPILDQWQLLSGMAVGREGAGLVVARDKIYCIGGYDGVNLLDSGECYDPETEHWSAIVPMSTRRSGEQNLTLMANSFKILL